MSPVSSWLSAHVYRQPIDEGFLAEVVAPFWDQLSREELVSDLFFVRYFDQGNHLRLRLRTRTEERRVVERVEGILDAEDVRWRCYEPEVERYGGPVGLAISERLFGASSRAVLRRVVDVTRDDPWSYDTSLTSALLMHWVSFHGSGWSLPELRRFCFALADTWARFGAPSGANRQTFLEERFRQFEKLYDLQRDAIVPFVQAVWDVMEAGAQLDDAWLETWRRDASNAAEKLTRACNAEELRKPPDVPEPGSMAESDWRRLVLWSIVGSWIHMTNNRLGVLNRDESWLAYLAGRCLREIDSNEDHD